MQAYNAQFARLYNLRWGGFAQQFAPRIRELYESTPLGQVNRSLLDVCCGTGQLAVHFLAAGYRVVGIDASEHMLSYARENASHFVSSGQARFVQGDASRFVLDERFGLVVSTYDALNHLEDEQALGQCFRCVFAVLENGGLFVFDLNTPRGLRRWGNLAVDDSSQECLLVTRGVYDEAGGKAWTQITGFIREESGLYSRADVTSFNTAFDLQHVRNALLECGWQSVYFAQGQDLQSPVEDPEMQGRVFVVARK
jgi:ubiquinone/menaquinone biosynthesis C-methylase UbiE